MTEPGDGPPLPPGCCHASSVLTSTSATPATLVVSLSNHELSARPSTGSGRAGFDSRPNGDVSSEPTRPDPKAFFPRPAGLDRLELLVATFLREVERVGDRRHRFEGHRAARWRRRRRCGAAIRVALTRQHEDGL